MWQSPGCAALARATRLAPCARGSILRCGRSAEAFLLREQRGLGAVGDAELLEHLADVALDRAFGQVEAARDLLVAEAFAERLQHGALARSERVERRCRPAHPVDHLALRLRVQP